MSLREELYGGGGGGSTSYFSFRALLTRIMRLTP